MTLSLLLRPAVCVGSALAACGLLASCGQSVSTAEVERGIQQDLKGQLQQGGLAVTVRSVGCVRQSDAAEGKCIATLGGAGAGSTLPVNVSYGDDGRYIWEVPGGDLLATVSRLAPSAIQSADDDSTGASIDSPRSRPTAPAPPAGGTLDQCAEQGYDRLSCMAKGWK